MHGKANSKYMKTYDPTKPLKFIPYLDMNNLYGWGMSGYLPYGGFKWLKNVDNFDVNSVSENSSKLIIYFITKIFSCICHWEWNWLKFTEI